MSASALGKDIRREIKKSLNRFISILLIVGMGSGFFIGVKTTAPSMRATADEMFNEQNLMDVELMSTVGFDEKDAQVVREMDGVDRVMAAYSLDAILDNEDAGCVVRLLSIPEDETQWINQPKLVEGRFPENDNECVALADNVLYGECKIGDVLQFKQMAGETDVDSVLSTREFTVVGLVRSPMYFSFNYGTSSIGGGSVMLAIMVPETAFTYARYTEMYVTLDDHAQGISSYEDAYAQSVEAFEEAVEPIGHRQFVQFINKTKAELSDAEEELQSQSDSADQELVDAKAQLDDALKQITEAIAQLQDGLLQYQTGYADYRNQVDGGIKEITRSMYELSNAERELAQGEEEYQKAYEETYAQLEAARKKLDDGWREYNKGMAELEDAEKQYNEGLAQYNDAVENYDNYKAQYEEGKRQYELAEDAYSDASTLVSSSQNIVNDLQTVKNAQDAGEEVPEGTMNNIASNASSAASAAGSLMQNELVQDSEIDTSGIGDRLTALGNEIANSDDVSQTMIDEANGILSDSQTQLNTARSELDSAKAQLEEAEQQLADAEEQIANGKQQLDEAKEKIDAGKKELAAAKEELDAGEREYTAGKKEADEKFAAARAELDAARKQIDEGYAQIAEARIAINQGVEEGAAELVSSQTELEDAQVEIQNAQEEYSKGLQEYNAAVEEAEAAIADGRQRISSARASIENVESGYWYTFSRDDMVVYYTNYTQDTDRIDAIAAIFPVFFLLVAALVCLTTMKRMVDEHLTEMGTYKALGYSSAAISMKYILYALAASIVGIVIGQVVCIQVLPQAIASAYSSMYNMPKLQRVVPWNMVIVSSLVSLASTVLVAWYSAAKELKVRAATMMRPKAPKPGKKIFLEKIGFVWSHMNFSNKVTARNMFRYKVRLIMTVLGVGGCMALMVSGFGLQDAIMPITTKQFGYICKYGGMAVMTTGYDEAQADQLYNDMMEDPRVESAMVISQRTGSVSAGKTDATLTDVYLYVPMNPQALPEMINLYDYKTGELLTLEGDSIIVTQKIAEKLGIDVGDTFVYTCDEVEYELYVSGIVENYVYHYIYMLPETCKAIFGNDIRYNSVMLNVTDETLADGGTQFVSDWLARNPDFYVMQMIDSAIEDVSGVMDSLNMVVVIMIIAAGALAFVVVYNLTNINISEREREIATLKVLGFTAKEVNLYVFQEIALMTLLGILLGAIGGRFLAMFMIQTVEVDMAMFIRKVDFSSYIYSMLLTVLFTVLVNLLMSKKMKNVSMVEALKAIE